MSEVLQVRVSDDLKKDIEDIAGSLGMNGVSDFLRDAIRLRMQVARHAREGSVLMIDNPADNPNIDIALPIKSSLAASNLLKIKGY